MRILDIDITEEEETMERFDQELELPSISMPLMLGTQGNKPEHKPLPAI
jgi:hypothetical protein